MILFLCRFLLCCSVGVIGSALIPFQSDGAWLGSRRLCGGLSEQEVESGPVRGVVLSDAALAIGGQLSWLPTNTTLGT